MTFTLPGPAQRLNAEATGGAEPVRTLSRSAAPGTAGPDAVRAPGAWRLLLETRAPWECAAQLLASRWLAPAAAGDGHPVLVFPGLGAADLTTLPMRRHLRRCGYTPYAWGQGLNLGPRRGVLDACRDRVLELAARHREKVSLVGWSLGGLYAREIAKQLPDQARCVVTLGTPFAGPAQATNAWRLYQLVSGQKVPDAAATHQLRQAPACPTTSIYSRSDGIVAWQCSLNAAAPHTENIEVVASHLGLGVNPQALVALADRLAQDPAAWRRFQRHGRRRWLFPAPTA